ncbi:hypothetical protein EC991_009905 [Linnemannia zychae]|nr:hypothetical protein EC991_009905 [Linnemannia zychae]
MTPTANIVHPDYIAANIVYPTTLSLASPRSRPRLHDTAAQPFMLYDVEGRVVESGKVYELQLAVRQLAHDALSFEYTGNLHGGVDNEDPLVTCEIVDSIVYLKYEDQYLYIADRHDIKWKVDLPEKDERLRFVLTNNNAFHISLWDGELVAQLEYVKCSYGVVWFREDDPMELLLKRIDN